MRQQLLNNNPSGFYPLLRMPRNWAARLAPLCGRLGFRGRRPCIG